MGVESTLLAEAKRKLVEAQEAFDKLHENMQDDLWYYEVDLIDNILDVVDERLDELKS